MIQRLSRLCLCATLALTANTLPAQPLPQAAPMKAPLSPPAVEKGNIGGIALSITYSSPRVKGRAGQLFGPGGRISKDPHYPVWRAGANSATAFHTDGDLKIGTLLVPKGDYTLFVDISDANNWTLIVSKDTGEWGLSYDSTKDLGRVPMKMSVPSSTVEDLTYSIMNSGGGKGTLTLTWENHSASVPLSKP